MNFLGSAYAGATNATAAAPSPEAVALQALTKQVQHLAQRMSQLADAVQAGLGSQKPAAAAEAGGLPVPYGTSLQLPLLFPDYLAWAGDSNETSINVQYLELWTTVPSGAQSWGLQFVVPPDVQVLSFSDWILWADYYTSAATIQAWLQYGLSQWTQTPTEVSPQPVVLAGPIGPPAQGALAKTAIPTPLLKAGRIPVLVTGQHEIPQDLTLVLHNGSEVDITAAIALVVAFIPASVWAQYFEPLRVALRNLWQAVPNRLLSASQGG